MAKDRNAQLAWIDDSIAVAIGRMRPRSAAAWLELRARFVAAYSAGGADYFETKDPPLSLPCPGPFSAPEPTHRPGQGTNRVVCDRPIANSGRRDGTCGLAHPCSVHGGPDESGPAVTRGVWE